MKWGAEYLVAAKAVNAAWDKFGKQTASKLWLSATRTQINADLQAYDTALSTFAAAVLKIPATGQTRLDIVTLAKSCDGEASFLDGAIQQNSVTTNAWWAHFYSLDDAGDTDSQIVRTDLGLPA